MLLSLISFDAVLTLVIGSDDSRFIDFVPLICGGDFQSVIVVDIASGRITPTIVFIL